MYCAEGIASSFLLRHASATYSGDLGISGYITDSKTGFEMMKKYLVTLAAFMFSLTACSNDTKADEQSATDSNQITKVSTDAKAIVRAKMMGLSMFPSMIVDAPIPGYQMAVTNQGNFFVSNDGEYMIYGRLFNIGQDEMKEVTDIGLNQFRHDNLESLKTEAISYPAKGEEKHKIYVFTDITCGYCRKMHREIEKYQEAGITVNYLAFPRSQDSSKQMQKIWCSDNRVQALTDAKLNNKVANFSCEGKKQTVEAQHEMGVKFGVRGTPALVLEDGTLFPGYREAGQLLQLLNETQAN